MPRRPKNSTALAQVRGQYQRTIGKWFNSRGKREPKKFYLGSDRSRAQLANALLEKLWAEVEADICEPSDGPLSPSVVVPSYYDPRPRWTPETLVLAEAARKGETRVQIARRARESDEDYVGRILNLRRRFLTVTAIAADEKTWQPAADRAMKRAASLRTQARNLTKVYTDEEEEPTGQRLYQAIDAYAEHVQTLHQRLYGRVEASTARRLKHASEDMDLSAFTRPAVEAITSYWRSRPPVKARNSQRASKPKPISIHTVQNQMKTFRRFLNWLDENEQWNWQMPRRIDRATRINFAALRTPTEISRLADGPAVFTIEQLEVIWSHARDIERLFLLLGLNAGMKPAEMSTLRWDEIKGDRIRRVRHKTTVLAEFKLWPETMAGLAWWEQVAGRRGDLVLLTKEGAAFNHTRFSRIWASLRLRIGQAQEEDPAWWLSISHLRKTGADLVRQVADGETASIYLSHGKPVNGNPLLDIYTRRHFQKVATALMAIRQRLDSVFKDTEAFTSTIADERVPSHPKRVAPKEEDVALGHSP